MCGRFGQFSPLEEINKMFGSDEAMEFYPNYNIAPTQIAAAIRVAGGSSRIVTGMRWGLIPSWSNDPKRNPPLINARSETVFEKPAFRAAIKHRRALIPADCFYEWSGRGKKKKPFFIGFKDKSVMGLAGIWESWKKEGQNIESFAVLTREANELVGGVHDRMPVILSPDSFAPWLDPALENRAAVEALFKPTPSDEMDMYELSPFVNSAYSQGARCIRAVSVETPGLF